MDILMLSLTKTLGWTFDPCWHDHFKSTPWESVTGKSRQDQRLGWGPDWPTSLQVQVLVLSQESFLQISSVNTLKVLGQMNMSQ